MVNPCLVEQKGCSKVQANKSAGSLCQMVGSVPSCPTRATRGRLAGCSPRSESIFSILLGSRCRIRPPGPPTNPQRYWSLSQTPVLHAFAEGCECVSVCWGWISWSLITGMFGGGGGVVEGYLAPFRPKRGVKMLPQRVASKSPATFFLMSTEGLFFRTCFCVSNMGLLR